MPISSFSVYPHVINEIVKRQPKSVLDLGIGFGTLGVGVRNWLELGYNYGNVELVGVEAFGDYKNPCWDLYSEIHIVDLQEYIQRDVKYDCICMLDVIEHMELGTAKKTVKRLKEMLNPGGVLLVSTPAVWHPQKAVYGNNFETHKCLLDVKFFLESKFRILKDGEKDDFGAQMLLGLYENNS